MERSCLTEVCGAMMGRKALASKLLSQVSLEELVPARHLLRRVAEAVDFDDGQATR